MGKTRRRCTICGKDFDTFEGLRHHVKSRHADGNQKWWLVTEDPSDLPFEAQEP